MVQVDAFAHDRKGITSEVRVGHGVDQQVGLGVLVIADEFGKEVGGLGGQVELVFAYAGYALLDELLRVLDRVHELLNGGAGNVTAQARLVEPLIGELLARARRVERLGGEPLEVEDLNALLSQDVREAIVLRLGDLQKRDVIKKQAAEVVWGEIQKLLAGTMQQHLLEGADLTVDVESVGHGSSLLRTRYGSALLRKALQICLSYLSPMRTFWKLSLIYTIFFLFFRCGPSSRGTVPNRHKR